MNTEETYEIQVLIQKAWETARPVVSRKGEFIGDLTKLETSFARRKTCAGFDAERCNAALRHALSVAQEMRRYQYSRMGSIIPDPVRRYEHLYTLAKHLRETLPDAPDILIDLACATIQYEWLR